MKSVAGGDQAEGSEIQKRVLVLPVLVQGGPYPENTEARLRSRYAVLSALSVAGFIVRSGEHLSYVDFPWPFGPFGAVAMPAGGEGPVAGAAPADSAEGTPPPKQGGAKGAFPVPFEWCDARPVQHGVVRDDVAYPSNRRSVGQGAWDKVLVMWLDDERFGESGLRKLAFLMERLNFAARDVAGPSRDKLGWKVIGPRGSATLRAMWGEALRWSANPPPREPSGLTILSATATVDEAAMRYGLVGANEPDPVRPMSFAFARAGVTLQRTIRTDLALADELVRELRLRGVEPTCHPIALVGEWDSLYARANVFAFAAAASGTESEKSESGARLEKMVAATMPQAWPRNITRHTYLRGIDGRLPSEGASKSEQQQPSESNEARLARLRGGPPESPEGLNQADYLRGLAAELDALESEYRRKDANGKGLRAIGVMGSDVYDKLLVLRALRNRFPNAVFFTTDLDARLVHASEWEAAHNLIVASHYGRVTRLSGGRVPPFRDSYQTSEFCAVLVATGDVTIDQLGAAGPRVYEVGRGGEVDLSVTPAGIVHPHRRLGGWWNARRKAAVVVALVFAAVMLLWAREPWRKLNWSKLLYYHLPFVILATGFIIACLLGLYSSLTPSGEPLLLFKGVSIWPSDAVRGFAAMLCVHFLYRGWKDLKESEDEISTDFKLKPVRDRVHRKDWTEDVSRWWRIRNNQFVPPRGEETETRLARFRLWWARRPWSLQVWASPTAIDEDRWPLDVNWLWGEYLYRGSAVNRLTRMLPLALAYAVVGYALLELFGYAQVPYRGWFSKWVDRFVVYGSLGLLVFLILFVADATRLCERFTHQLCKRTNWPAEELARYLSPRVPGDEARRAEEQAGIDEYLDIQLLACQTADIGRLIYYPFLVIAILIVSRNTYFDNWDWPVAFLLAVTSIALVTVVAAALLRRAAEKARGENLKSLRRQLLQMTIRGGLESPQADKLRHLIERIENESRGAFAPFGRHPLLRSFLLPSGGVGVWALLEWYANSR